jgi:hypothetical protein
MIRQPRYSVEEHTRLGEEIYERQIRSQLDPAQHGKIVAINVDTGDFEVADDGLTAANRLLANRPDAQIWCVRIGYPAVHRCSPRATGCWS